VRNVARSTTEEAILQDSAADRTKLYLAFIWGTFALVQFVLVGYLNYADDIGPEHTKSLFSTIGNAYAPYVALIVAFFVASKPSSKKKGGRVTTTLALVASVVWNLGVLALTAALLFPGSEVESTIQNLGFVASGLSLFAAPVLGAYYANS
jgi:hypothetical protein